MLRNELTKSAYAYRGFTLLEILVSATIFAVGILGTIRALTTSLRAGTRASRTRAAVAIARKQIEKVENDIQKDSQPRKGSTGPYSWTLEFTEKPNNLILASVQVKWFTQGREEEFRLSQIFLPPMEQSDE